MHFIKTPRYLPKISVMLFSLVFMLLSLVLCFVPATASVFHGDLGDYSLAVPEGWEALPVTEEAKAEGIEALFRADRHNQESALLSISVYKPLRVENFDKLRQKYFNGWTEATHVAQKSGLNWLDTLPHKGGIYWNEEAPALYIIHKGESDSGKTLQELVGVFMANDQIVQLHFMALPADYPKSLPLFNQALKSFQLNAGHAYNARLKIQEGYVAEETDRPVPWYLDEDIVQFIFFLVLMVVGFTSGTILEKRHYVSIQQREQALNNLPAVSMKLKTLLGNLPAPEVEHAEMVSGSVVLSEDYFKGFLAGIKTLFGGTLTSYESLLDRARREALLRMKAQAVGCNIIVNTRFETSSIGQDGGQNGNGVKTVEVLVYGTAIYLKNADSVAHLVS